MSDAITLTQVIAFYAASVATANAAWTFYKDWNDRGRVTVRVYFGAIGKDAGTEENIFFWKITSVGKKPVVVTHVCGQFDISVQHTTNHVVIYDPEIPKRLEPGDYHMSMCRKYDWLGRSFVRLYAIDSLGREYNAPSTDVDEVNKTITDLHAKGITQSSMKPWARGAGKIG